MKNRLKLWVLNKLWRSARSVVEKGEPTVIVVTGSVGKTTTKDAIVHLLSSEKRPVRFSSGNMNTEFSLPLAITGQTRAPRNLGQWIKAFTRACYFFSPLKPNTYLVLEYASEKPGDIAYLAKMLPIDIAVFTRFVLSHSGNNLEEIAQEKLSLLEGLKEEGTIIANLDDSWQEPACKDKRALTYGQNKGDLIYSHFKQDSEGTRFTVKFKDEKQDLKSQLIGIHQLTNLAAALLVGKRCGLTFKELAKRAATFQAPLGRMRLIEGRKNTTIIDDSYNSSPEAALEALKTLKQLAGKRRTVAILGNMNALGKNTVSTHIKLGQQVAEQGIDYLVAVGPNAKRIIRGAREGGMPEQHLIAFLKPDKLIPVIDSFINNQDMVLVKASQDGMRFERIVKALMARPSQAKELLVRQDF